MPDKLSRADKPRKGVDRALGHLTQLDREGMAAVAGKLCAEREMLEAIIQSLREGVVVIERWGNILLINDCAEALLGLENYDARPASEPNLWRASPELAKLLKVASDGSLNLIAPLTQQTEVHYPTQRLLRLFATPIGEKILLVLSDQTAEAEDSQHEKEEARMNALTQLAAGVAHEIGNPLNALQIHLQLMERALAKEKLSPKAESIARSLKVCTDEVRRLDQIVRNFLQALRPTPVHLRPTDLMEVLEEVLSVLQAELAGAKIKVEVKLPGIIPMVMADAEVLKQVYFNVLKNAREASPAGSAILIQASSDDERLHLHFTDSGKGIQAEHLTHLFEPYHTTKPGGSGLGLMIAQKIMRAHGGTIKVESREGAGTTVTLSFPLQYRRFKPLSASAAAERPQLPESPR